MGEVTAKLAEIVSSVKFSDLPQTTVQKTKEILLDSIGCALGGYALERAKIAIGISESLGTQPEATIIGYGKASSLAASFVNGELINCLDFDVISQPGTHVAPYVIPCVLALCEKTGRSGKDLITAAAVALEVGSRAIGCLSQLKLPKSEPPYWEEAPRFSYTSAIFGGVAGACKSLGLGPDKIRSAFGVGGTSTPIPGGQKWEYLEGPSVNLKYGCWSGWVALLGTMAALATQKGFTGDPAILDGEFGYWQMYGSPFFKEDMLLGNLGKVWNVDRAAFKFYPCCYIDHSSLEGIERLVTENKIAPEDIDEILVYGDTLMLTPNRWPAEIKTNEDAQFSHAYLFSLAVLNRGKPGPQWHVPSSLNDPKIRALMPRVKVKVHPRIEALVAEKLKMGAFPITFSVIVEITARGKKFTTEVPAPKGYPTNPVTVPQLIDKFTHNASFSLLKRDRIEPVIDTIWKLEKLDSVAELTRLLTID